MAESRDPLANPLFRGPGWLERLAEAFLGQNRPLDCVQIETTSVCSGACVYCPHTTQRKAWKSRHMSREVFASLWPLLRRCRRAHLQGWGEPLLNPSFFDFQAQAAKAGCLTSTTSCGLKMDADLAARLANSGMDLIAFSLVGTDSESNAPRAKVPFERVCESVRLLREAIGNSRREPALEIHFAYLLLADRIGAVSRLPELMDELDVEMAVVSTLDYLAVPGQRQLAFYPEEREKIAQAGTVLEKAAAEAGRSGRIIHYELPGAEPAGGGCRENIGRSLYVDAEGQVSPCIYLNVPGSDPVEKRRIYGNSLQKEPLAIWKEPEYQEFRRKLLSGEPDAVCLRCPKRFES